MKSVCLMLALLPGCLLVDHTGPSGEPACRTPTSMSIDTGASISHTAGIDPGYYATYTAGGQWHFEWTCDTKLSAIGCNFTGTVIVDTPPGGAGAICTQCEPSDLMSVHEVGATTQVDFDTVTSTGLDGLTVNGLPGHPATLDLQVNGIYQNELVFIPSRGVTASPGCMPLALTPSSP